MPKGRLIYYLDWRTVYVDNQPYYFKQAQQTPVYSFPVTPGIHSLSLRTYDRIIDIDSIRIEKAKKTILSVNGEKSYPVQNIRVSRYSKKEAGLLTDWEIEKLKYYMLSVENNFQPILLTTSNNKQWKLPHQTWLYDNQQVYLLNSQPFSIQSIPVNNTSFLVGPFPDSPWIHLFSNDKAINSFKLEGGYNYTIREGYLKLKEWKPPFFFKQLEKGNARADFNQYVLTKQHLKNQRIGQVNSLLKTTPLPARTIGKYMESTPEKLKLQLELKQTITGNNIDPLLIFFFNEDDSSKQVYQGNSRIFNDLRSEKSRLLLFFEDYSYYEQKIRLQSGGKNYLRMDSITPNIPDSLSLWAMKFVEKQIFLNKIKVEVPVASPFYGKTKKSPLPVKNRLRSSVVLNYSHKQNETVSGTVIDATDGMPLPGASISIAGTKYGTVTDINGHFTLKAPVTSGTLEFLYLGYQKQEMIFTPGYIYNIIMEEDYTALDEVVVIGFGSQRKKSGTIVGSLSEIRGTNSIPLLLEGRMAGVIAGTGNSESKSIPTLINESSPPLIILNGLPYSGQLEDINKQNITSLKFIEPEKAIQLFGKQHRGGVWIVTTVSENNLSEEDQGIQLRRNFHDDAFWQPALRTDQQGKVSFEISYPDDITSWKADFIAMNDHQMSGLRSMNIQSFKATSAQLYLPRFGIEGDSLNAIGKLTNLQDDTISVKQKIKTGNIEKEKQETSKKKNNSYFLRPIQTRFL